MAPLRPALVWCGAVAHLALRGASRTSYKIVAKLVFLGYIAKNEAQVRGAA
jgi:hypothetical protein